MPDHHLRFRLLEQDHHFCLTEDMEFHVVELPKFTKSTAELAGGLDVWLYFLWHAEMMDTEQLPASLQQPLVLRALEELKMLTQTEIEREFYEARRKAQLDQNTLIRAGAIEGEKKGKIELIRFCERLLGKPITAEESLVVLGLEELTRLADELQVQALKPN